MKTYIVKADFECLVLLNGQELGILESGNLEFQNQNSFTLTFFPFEKKYLPFSCKCFFESNNLICKSEQCKILQLPNHYYELQFKPLNFNQSKPLRISNNIVETPIGKISVNISSFKYSENAYVEIIHNNNIIFEYEIQDIEKLVSVNGQYVGNEYFIMIKGIIQDYEHLLVLHINNSLSFALELLAHQIEIEQDCIKVLTKCFDIHKHGKVNVYSIVDGQLIKTDSYLVLINEKKQIKKEFIPYAFFESLRVGDIKLSREYLTDELNEDIDDEHLQAYFGDFKEVRQNIYENDFNSVLLIYQDINNMYYKKCKITFLNNKIDNLELV